MSSITEKKDGKRGKEIVLTIVHVEKKTVV